MIPNLDPESLLVRGAEVEKALELLRSFALSRGGGIIFLAGPPGSGRTATLRAIMERSRRETLRPAVVAGGFASSRGGEYVPWPQGAEDSGLVAKILNAVGETTTSVLTIGGGGHPVVRGVAELLSQLLKTGAAQWELVETTVRAHSHPTTALEEVVRAAARRRPVVWILDDFDQAGGAWAAASVRALSGEIVHRLPVLVVASLDAPLAPDFSAVDSSFASVSASVREALDLVRHGFAEWWPLPPLSKSEFEAWLGPADPDVAELLHAASAGNSLLLAELWKECRSNVDGRGAVVRYDARRACWEWHAAGEDRLSLGAMCMRRLERLLQFGSPFSVLEAREILAHAAREGLSFTAEAVAHAVGRDRDALIDFFDDFLLIRDERPEGLLEEVSAVTFQDIVTGSRSLWIYRFCSHLVWHALRTEGLPPAAGASASLGMARALAAVYYPQEARVARTIARLLSEGGQPGDASTFHVLGDRLITGEALRRQAEVLMVSGREGWSTWDYAYAASVLLSAAEETRWSSPLRETLRIYEEASALAARSGVLPYSATALLNRGRLHYHLVELPAARARIQEARSVMEALQDRRGLLTAQYESWRIDVAGRTPSHAAAAASAMEIAHRARGIGHTTCEADARVAAGLMLLEAGRVDEAAPLLRETAEFTRQNRCWKSHAEALRGLGKAAHATGDLAAARSSTREALEIFHRLDDRFDEAITRVSLSTFALEAGDRTESAAELARALTLAQEIGSALIEASAFQHVSAVAAHLDRWMPALHAVLLTTILRHEAGIPPSEKLAEMISVCVSRIVGGGPGPGMQARGHAVLSSALVEAQAAYARDRGHSIVRDAFVT